MFPCSGEQAILNDTFPIENAGMAFAGLTGHSVVVGTDDWAWLGGWITDNFSWRLIVNQRAGGIIS